MGFLGSIRVENRVDIRPNIRPNIRWKWPNIRYSAETNFSCFGRTLAISLVKTLLSRNFCQICVRLNRSNFHSVMQCGTATILSQKFRQINLFTKELYSKLHCFDGKNLRDIEFLFVTQIFSVKSI